MKVLLLGGTGAMGVHLMEYLSEKSQNQIYVTTRSYRTSGKDNCHYIVGNAHDMTFLSNTLEDSWDVIVDFMVYTTREFQSRVDFLLSKTKQYVFLSSSRVYADSVSPIKEDSPRLLDVSEDQEYLNTDEYALAKARQENILKSRMQKNWTIIRPYITFSEERLQLGVLEKESWLFRALHGKKILFSEDVADKYTTLTYGRDVARGIAAVLNEKEAYGQAFHITQSKTYTWREILTVYLDVLEKELKKRPEVCMVPTAPALKRNGKYQVKYDRLFNRSFDNSAIGNFIDVSEFSDPKDKLVECLRVFLQKRNFRSISWSIEAENDRITREYARIGDFNSFREFSVYFLCRYMTPVEKLLRKIQNCIKR